MCSNYGIAVLYFVSHHIGDAHTGETSGHTVGVPPVRSA